MQTARLADIAAQAGVSEATASRVMNGKPGVAATTRQKVLAALDVLGYERPLRLRHRSAGQIGLITPELSNPIFPAFAQVIEQNLTGYGYTAVLCTQHPGGATEDELVEALAERGVMGIVFLSGLHADLNSDPERYARLVGRGVPYVLINGYNPAVAEPLRLPGRPGLGPDGRAASAGPRPRADRARRRPRPFRARPAQGRGLPGGAGRGRPGAAHPVHRRGRRGAAGALLDRGCTGIVCGSDLMALGAIRAVRERGLTVPGDVSVVGYDDSPLVPFTDPPLTTIRQPVEAMGAAAVGALLEEISGNPVQRSEFVFQTELVVRGSTAQVRRRG